MTLLLLGMIAITSAALAQGTAVPEPVVMTTEPRDFGYFVGDTFRREIDVVVSEPYKLNEASRPAPGRLNYWLDLRRADVKELSLSGNRRRYRIVLDYQTFYVPLSPAKLTVPGMTLRFSQDGEAVDAEVPYFTFIMAPLREVQPEKPENGPAGYLKPDAVPKKMSTLGSRIALGGGVLCALLGLTLLARHRAWWPFHVRRVRPFTKAAHALKELRLLSRSAASYRAGLLELHRAFDLAAGRSLLAEDVPGFISAHDEFRPLKEDITRFFAVSRQAFFGADIEGASEIMPLEAVARLGSRLGEAERRAA